MECKQDSLLFSWDCWPPIMLRLARKLQRGRVEVKKMMVRNVCVLPALMVCPV